MDSVCVEAMSPPCFSLKTHSVNWFGKKLLLASLLISVFFVFHFLFLFLQAVQVAVFFPLFGSGLPETVHLLFITSHSYFFIFFPGSLIRVACFLLLFGSKY